MAGHLVEVRASGAEAIERLSGGELPDVVLADVMMPGMDGMETLQRIKADHPRVPVILVTAQQLTREEHSAADALVSKPIDFGELFAEIERLAAS